MAKSILSVLLVVAPTLLDAKPIQVRAPGGSKRGVAFEDKKATTLFPGLGWGYNWLSSATDTCTANFEYVPMLHSDEAVFCTPWNQDVDNAVKAGAKHILSFNEPDQCGGGGACMQDVGRTLASHEQHVQPIADKYPELKVGAPAVTNGEKSENGTPMGVNFLEPFIKGCDEKGLRIDFVAAHWYDEWPADSTQQGYKLDYFKEHLKKIHKAGGERPVWLTEFGVWTGDQVDFVKKVMPWLDEQPWIERYAFHFAKQGVLVNDDMSGLTELGQTYASG